MNKYQKGKERAWQKAWEWQMDFNNHSYSWGELLEWQYYFERLAKRYGLVRVFKNEGII